MNQTKRSEIAKFCESLTQDEAIELCKNLIAENEELISANEELEAINFLFACVNDVSIGVIGRK